jgi:twitching motility protein PilT
MDYTKLLETLFTIVIQENGSDLHLSEGKHPTLRVTSSLIPLLKQEKLTKESLTGFLSVLLTEPQRKRLITDQQVDFAYEHGDKNRFRGNAYFQRGHITIALRLISNEIKTLEDLNLPPQLETFTQKKQGFFLVVGPTGHGKSTTLAALVEIINARDLVHVVTIEDPVEYIFSEKQAIIHQREVRTDTPNFPTALAGVFRQDADVVMIGEMREKETISTAVTAAETGHLVFSTLHTNTAVQTIDRIIDSFPPEQQGQIRMQLASSLTGIFSQRLIPRVSGGLIVAYELLINNTAVSNLIRTGKTHQIETVLETSLQEGMINMDRSLMQLVKQGEITPEDAFRFSVNPKVLERMM